MVSAKSVLGTLLLPALDSLPSENPGETNPNESTRFKSWNL
jgi:hypothetical protein